MSRAAEHALAFLIIVAVAVFAEMIPSELKRLVGLACATYLVWYTLYLCTGRP